MPHPLDCRSVSTWSLHRTLKNFVADGTAVDGGTFMTLPPREHGLTLLELIPELATRGYQSVQIVHFHLESTDDDYLQRVRQALAEHRVALDALLVDDGDLMADDVAPHLEWFDRWLTVAETLGATHARLCAGRKAPTPELLAASARHLAALAELHPDGRIVTENWMESMPDADSVNAVLDAAGDRVGLLIDLANWKAPEKYDGLVAIAPRAELCHAKCIFKETGPDEADFRQTLGILKDAGYTAPLALIYDGPDDDEWAALDVEWDIVQEVFR